MDEPIQKLILEAGEAARQEEEIIRKGDELLDRAKVISATITDRVQRVVGRQDRSTGLAAFHSILL